MTDNNKNKIWFVWDLVIFSTIILSIVISFVKKESDLSGAFFFFAIGVFLISSNRLKDKLFFSRALNWVTTNVSKPKTKINHIFWGLFSIGMALLMLISPSEPTDANYLERVKSTPEFWISIMLVVLFNIIVGLYTSSKHNRKPK